MTLTRRIRTTEDANGCEFRYTLLRSRDSAREIAEQVYIAHNLGVQAETLVELKRRVANL